MKIVRVILFACALVVCALAARGQSLGTKSDIVVDSAKQAGPIVQPWDMIQMVLAVGIVAALLKWVLPKAIGKFGKRLTTPVGSGIQIEESANFGAGQLQVVSVRGKTLLIAVTAQGASCLADLSETRVPDKPEPDAFFDILDKADPAKAVVTTPEPEEEGMSMEQAVALISAAQSRIHSPATPLDRLNRITGS
ncbi:MAG: flagellar biosynthetic protein FliO [Armatimonadetes bacterium]|nr:flagellar biosynthetic protein FliO [Armatimonadota bacterium]